MLFVLQYEGEKVALTEAIKASLDPVERVQCALWEKSVYHKVSEGDPLYIWLRDNVVEYGVIVSDGLHR
jgi:hypothetical protein